VEEINWIYLKLEKNPLIEIIPINTGCLNNCTYCKTKFARGNLNSYPVEELSNRVKSVVEEGIKEIWITSEDTGTYGRDIDTNLPTLMWKMIESLPEDTMLRLGMTNPPYIMEYIDEMAKILNHPRIYSFLHIPVQSGCSRILDSMKRKYTRDDFEFLVDKLMQKVPNIHIATDIICGFPTETDEEFEETLSLVSKYKFITLNISQFYPRPGTPAANMPQINTKIKKERSRKITELFESYQPYEKFIGNIYEVLCTDTSYQENYFVAHNKYYHQVLVPMKEEYMGKMLTVKITSADKFYMIGEPTDEKIPMNDEKIPMNDEKGKNNKNEPMQIEDTTMNEKKDKNNKKTKYQTASFWILAILFSIAAVIALYLK